jgi:AcrR family transcriptional regulator
LSACWLNDDVARALGVSHGSVYRHFPSKAALRDAVTERWLAGISSPLEAVASEEGPAPERLQRWLDLLVGSKRSKALADPELFATYVELTADARGVVKAHVHALVGQLAQIIAGGVAQRAWLTNWLARQRGSGAVMGRHRSRQTGGAALFVR